MDHPEPSLPPQPPPQQSTPPAPTASDIEAAMSWANMPADQSEPNPPPAIPAEDPGPFAVDPAQHPAGGQQAPQAPLVPGQSAPPPDTYPGHPAAPQQSSYAAPHREAPRDPHHNPYNGPAPAAGYPAAQPGHAAPGYGSPAPYPYPPSHQPPAYYPPAYPGGPAPAPGGPGSGYAGHYAPAYTAPTERGGNVPLSSEISCSDPRNPDHQTLLLTRIRELSARVPADAADLAANLTMATTLTQYLIRMGGLGPEDVLQIVTRLVSQVEQGLPQVAQVPPNMSSHRHERVVLNSRPPVDTGGGGLHLVGQGAEKGRLLGELMIQLGFCTRAEVDRALVTQKAAGVLLGEALVSTGAADWKQVKQAISVQNQFRD